MFNLFKSKKNAKNVCSKDYQLSYDNLAIPEIHTKKSSDNTENEDKKSAAGSCNEQAADSVKASVIYDDVAVPEVRIKNSSAVGK